jgi:hypothetical protein
MDEATRAHVDSGVTWVELKRQKAKGTRLKLREVFSFMFQVSRDRKFEIGDLRGSGDYAV